MMILELFFFGLNVHKPREVRFTVNRDKEASNPHMYEAAARELVCHSCFKKKITKISHFCCGNSCQFLFLIDCID